MGVGWVGEWVYQLYQVLVCMRAPVLRPRVSACVPACVRACVRARVLSLLVLAPLPVQPLVDSCVLSPSSLPLLCCCVFFFDVTWAGVRATVCDCIMSCAIVCLCVCVCVCCLLCPCCVGVLCVLLCVLCVLCVCVCCVCVCCVCCVCGVPIRTPGRARASCDSRSFCDS